MPLVTHTIGGSTLTCDSQAFAQYLRMIAAGMPTGGITSSWRDPAVQERLFLENYTRVHANSAKRDPRRWNGVLYWRRHRNSRTGGLTVAVAVPGSSLHEDGLALDLAQSQRVWVRDNGERFGWYWPDWARNVGTYEPWHMEFDKTRVKPDPKPEPDGSTEEDDMPLNDDDKAWIVNAIRDTAVDLMLAVAGRETSWERGVSDAAFGAQRAVDNRALQAMANGSDPGGRSMRDHTRAVITGDPKQTAATSAQVASITPGAPVTTSGEFVIQLTGTAKPSK